MNTYLLISTVVGALLVMAWRVRETTRPVTTRKIVIPPLGMSTGLSMFAYAPMRIPVLWAFTAFTLGVLVFSYPLIKSSKLTRIGDVVMLKRSRAFLWIIVGLFAVRLVARNYVERYVSPMQTAAIFFLLAFGMILTWRVRMFIEFRKLQRSDPAAAPDPLPSATSST